MPFIIPVIWIVLAILLIAFLASNIVVVPQAKAYISAHGIQDCISRYRCLSALPER